MIAQIVLAYSLATAQPQAGAQSAQPAGIEERAEGALRMCKKTRGILENRSPAEKGISSIKYSYPIVLPEEAKQLFPSSDGLESIAVFSEDSMLSTMFFRYKDLKNRWDVAISYLAANGEPRGVYHARGNLENVGLKDAENSAIKIVLPPDMYFGLRHNRENINNLDFNRLSSYIRRAYYSCKDEIRMGFERNFEKASRIKPKRRIEPNPEFHHGGIVVPVRFGY